MKNASFFTRILCLILSFTSGMAPLSLAMADEELSGPGDYKNYKVVGRGVVDRETLQVLQLVCVGPHVQKDSPERECTTLNFLLSEVSGQQRLVGRPFDISFDNGDTVKAQLTKELRRRKLYNDSLENSRVMLATRSIVKKQDGGWRTIAIIFGAGTLLAGFPIAAAVGVAVGIPLLCDLLVLPFALIEDAQFDNKALSANSMEALRDRAKYQWQVKPQKMRTKRFQQLLAVLVGEGVDTHKIDSLDQQVKETEEDRLADEKESQEKIDASFPAFSGDISNSCFVDKIEIRYERKTTGLYLQKKAYEYYPQLSHLEGVSGANLEKLAIAAYLKSQGFTVDEGAILRGDGSRGSVFSLDVTDHSFMKRIGSVRIESKLERSSALQGATIVKMENVSTLITEGDHREAESLKGFQDFLDSYFPMCEAMNRGKTEKFSGSFF